MGTKTSLSEKMKSLNGNNGLGKLYMAKAIYSFGVDGGVISTITPKQNVDIPKNAVIVGGTANATTALASASSNVTIGTSAGSSSSALLGTTNYTSFSTNALLNLVPVFATPVKMSAKGNLTIAFSGTITAGVVEIVIYYYVAKA